MVFTMDCKRICLFDFDSVVNADPEPMPMNLDKRESFNFGAKKFDFDLQGPTEHYKTHICLDKTSIRVLYFPIFRIPLKIMPFVSKKLNFWP